MHASTFRALVAIALCASYVPGTAHAEPIPVRFRQGSSHGFFALTTLDGVTLGTGESTQVIHGERVTSRLVFHFRDGSIDDDTTVFTQRGVFRLISDHHIQRGPSFPKPIDFLIDTATGNLTFRAEDGKPSQEHMDLPLDISNGLAPNLLLNIVPSSPETKVSFLVPEAKARMVRLSIKPTGTTPFVVSGLRRKATDFTIHIELGGVSGVIAPILGKQPADYHVWIGTDSPPAFVREEGPLYEHGPIWRIEQLSPSLHR